MKRTPIMLALTLVLSGGASADDIDHEQALKLVREGLIKPLSEVIETVRREVPGDLLEVELETEDGVYVYELKILRPNGRVQEIEAAAATGKILTIEDDD